MYGLSDVEEVKKDWLFTMKPTTTSSGAITKVKLEDNTGWYSYKHHYMGHRTTAGKSQTSVQNTSVTSLESLIEKKHKEDPKAGHWAQGTEGWKDCALSKDEDFKSMNLKLQDMQMINPYVVATEKKRRHIKFVVTTGNLTGTPVFVYLHSLNKWKDWNKSKEELASSFLNGRTFNLRYRPRVVKGKDNIIAIHCSIDALEDPIPFNEVWCVCCEEKFEEKDTLPVDGHLKVCLPCEELYGDWLHEEVRDKRMVQ